MKLVKIGYYTSFIVPDEIIPDFVRMLGEVALKDGNDVKPVEFEVTAAPDLERDKLRAELIKEIKDSNAKEVETYKGYWLNAAGERDKLKQALQQANAKISEDDRIPF